jgi:phosphoenolpyruvate synthase/pyruvate phosphate dikinase
MGGTITLSRARLEQLGSDAARRWLYDFAAGWREKREPLGGKEANLAEMARVLGREHLSTGFTITAAALSRHAT